MPIIGVFYVCMSLVYGEAVACSARMATEPPRQVRVLYQACGYYSWSGGSAFVDCGQAF